MLSKRIASGVPAESMRWPKTASMGEDPVEEATDGQATRRAPAEPTVSQIIEQVRREAFCAGESAARDALEGKLRVEQERGARAVADLATYKARLRREAEAETVELALAIARKVLKRELHVDPSAIEGIARAALDRIGAREVLRVRVAPASYTAIQQMLASIGPAGAIELESDATLDAGGVVVETRRGALDASVDGQLDEIAQGLADRLGRGRSC
jgi:flagellar assembly protein FliH